MTTTKSSINLAAATKDLDAAAKALSTALAEESKDPRVISDQVLTAITDVINQAKALFSSYSLTLSPAERARKIGLGIKNWGFVEACYESAKANPRFLPAYLSIDEFSEAVEDFTRKRSLYMALQQFLQEISDSMLVASDAAYRDALEYYNTLKVAAKQKIPGAETEFKSLSTYFKRTKTASSEPTEKQLERDFHSLLHGTKDGRIVIENERPAISGGERKIIDEVHSERIEAKETIDLERN